MLRRRWTRSAALAALLAGLMLALPVFAQQAFAPQGPYRPSAPQPDAYQPSARQPSAYQPGARQPSAYEPPAEQRPSIYQRPDARRPAYSPQPPAGRMPVVPAQAIEPVRQLTAAELIPPPNPNEHPLARAITWAKIGLEKIEKVEDYSATVVKRERIDDKLNDYEYMFVKIRRKPFSVYLYFLSPASVKGQEVIYVDGQNNGNMWAHTVGVRDSIFGTVSLPPNGMLAMRGQRYPLTEIGILNLTGRLIEIGEKDMKFGECEVEFMTGAKVNDRQCTCLQVVHPVPRRDFLFHIARIFVDDELCMPIRYEAWAWPDQPGGKPQLIEEYTYLNLKLNNGFTDMDFNVKNPNYRFR